MAGLTKLVERISTWLVDLGSWIFGALLAFNLVILGALLTEPVDSATLIATAALAVALPLNVAGFLLLRLAVDMKKVDLERVATAAFQEAGFELDAPASGQASPETSEKRRIRVVLRYSSGLLAVTSLLTLGGVTAALWQIAWWIGAGFIAATVASLAVVTLALASITADTVWRGPPGT